MPKLVRERHQRHCAQTGLHVFLRLVFRQAFEDFLELRLKNLERVADRNLKKLDPEIARQHARVLDAAARRVRAGHGNTCDIPSAQRIGCDHCRYCGIDAAAQTDYHGMKTAFGTVIAEPEGKRSENLLRYFALSKFDCG